MTAGSSAALCRVGPCKLAEIGSVPAQLPHHRRDFVSLRDPHRRSVRFGLNIINIDAGHHRRVPVRCIGCRMSLNKQIGAPGDFPGPPADKLRGVFIDNGNEFHYFSGSERYRLERNIAGLLLTGPGEERVGMTNEKEQRMLLFFVCRSAGFSAEGGSAVPILRIGTSWRRTPDPLNPIQ